MAVLWRNGFSWQVESAFSSVFAQYFGRIKSHVQLVWNIFFGCFPILKLLALFDYCIPMIFSSWHNSAHSTSSSKKISDDVKNHATQYLCDLLHSHPKIFWLYSPRPPLTGRFKEHAVYILQYRREQKLYYFSKIIKQYQTNWLGKF